MTRPLATVLTALAVLALAGGCGDERAHDRTTLARTSPTATAATAAAAAPEDGAGDDATAAAPGDGAGDDGTGGDTWVALRDTDDGALDATDASAPGDATDAIETDPLGTFANPIVVASLPFDDARDTRLGPSSVFDRYDCDVDSDESGLGFVYRVDVQVAGVLTATLDDRPGDDVDVDVHLLTDDAPDACLVRDNVGLAFAVEPGSYWLVVDTWVDGGGHPLAGRYALHVALAVDDATLAPLGTFANPIGVSDFPFHDARSTAIAPSSKADRYACAPAIDEGGPEVVYRVAVPTRGTLTATLDDVPGDASDVDLQLMTGPDPATCVARGNVSLARAVEPGTFWLTVDTWVDATGLAHTGPFHLTVDFAADAPTPPGAGTVGSPILIGALPFSDARSTADAASDSLDAYACAPTIAEGGPEVVYQVHIASAGFLVASVTDLLSDATDIDVHVLSGVDSSTCIARGNRTAAVSVSPGDYRVVVDTFVDGTGRALTGPYQLDVALVPRPDLTHGCVLLYGDTRDDGAGQVGHRAVAKAMAQRCASATLVHTGDYVGSGTSDADWVEFWDNEGALHSAGRRLLPARGNHDGSWSNLVARLGAAVDGPLPDSNYARPVGDGLWVIALDSESDPALGESFLRSVLDAPSHADDRFIVAFHRPLYPSVGGHSGWVDGQTHWAPILAAHAGKVVVVTGHDHGMSRESVDGVRYITAGGGGAPLYGCSQIHAGTRFCESVHGYTACDHALHCTTWKVEDDGRETLLDAFDGP